MNFDKRDEVAKNNVEQSSSLQLIGACSGQLDFITGTEPQKAREVGIKWRGLDSEKRLQLSRVERKLFLLFRRKRN